MIHWGFFSPRIVTSSFMSGQESFFLYFEAPPDLPAGIGFSSPPPLPRSVPFHFGLPYSRVRTPSWFHSGSSDVWAFFFSQGYVVFSFFFPRRGFFPEIPPSEKVRHFFTDPLRPFPFRDHTFSLKGPPHPFPSQRGSFEQV